MAAAAAADAEAATTFLDAVLLFLSAVSQNLAVNDDGTVVVVEVEVVEVVMVFMLAFQEMHSSSRAE